MNKVILLGRLTADPEIRTTNSGLSTCRFTVAVNRRFADKQSGEHKADFIVCVAWRKTAEIVAKYFCKGKQISLEGTIQTGSYQDRNHSDVTHYTTEVIVENVEFVGSKNTDNDNSYNNSSPPPVSPDTNNSAGSGSVSCNDLSAFEEILSDEEVPF